MTIASDINESGLAVEFSAYEAACAKQTCKGFVRYIFADDSMITIDDDGIAKVYDSSKPCGGKWDTHFYDDGFCEFCGIHEDEA